MKITRRQKAGLSVEALEFTLPALVFVFEIDAPARAWKPRPGDLRRIVLDMSDAWREVLLAAAVLTETELAEIEDLESKEKGF